MNNTVTKSNNFLQNGTALHIPRLRALHVSKLKSVTITVKCPVCGTGFDQESQIVHCSRCFTIHHKDCFDYNGKCATYGCECSETSATKVSRKHSDSKMLIEGYWTREVPLTFKFKEFINGQDAKIVILTGLILNILITILPFMFFILWRHRFNLWFFMTAFCEFAIIWLKNSYPSLRNL